MPAITDTTTLSKEIVITERVTSTEFKITEVHENIENRFVRVDIELGPFTTETSPAGQTRTRGTGRRGLTVWQNEAYDAVRDTWTNTDLITRVAAILNA